MKFILAEKQGMSQTFDEEGNVVPVTLVEAGPCVVTQIKTEENDGYTALQVGFKEQEDVKKPQQEKPYKYLKEFRVEEEALEEYEVGDKITLEEFEEGDSVKVTGVSKGKGFQGVMKRHGFSGLPASHGTKDKERSPGSIGSAYPQRVQKGTKMAGHGGAEVTTVKNLKIVEKDAEENLMAIKGGLPGPDGNLIEIREQ
ncbi:MAG: 50S ribosomal protein L3 [Candidatus Paceibacterota bacterium]